jgi:hypothetical protein
MDAGFYFADRAAVSGLYRMPTAGGQMTRGG